MYAFPLSSCNLSDAVFKQLEEAEMELLSKCELKYINICFVSSYSNLQE